jgi:hypothetical protein
MIELLPVLAVGAVSLLVVAVLTLTFLRLLFPSEYDRRQRLIAFARLRRTTLRLPDETEEQHTERIHASLLAQLGLPKSVHVVEWLKGKKPSVLPPPRLVELALALHGPRMAPDQIREVITLQAVVEEAAGLALPASERLDLRHLQEIGAAPNPEITEAYTLHLWTQESAALHAGEDPLNCPACLRRGFYGPREADQARRYRACKFCGFWQNVGQLPHEIIRYECRQPDHWTMDWREPHESWQCPICTRPYSPSAAVPWPADDPTHPWHETPTAGSQADYISYWVSRGCPPPPFGII